jgi:hypothetical protein
MQSKFRAFFLLWQVVVIAHTAFTQFSSFKPCTRSNSRVLLVNKVISNDKAIAAI